MHRKPVTILLVFAVLLVLFPLNQIVRATSYADVTVQQAKSMADSNPLLLFLDIRNQSEYDSGHIRNARLIPLSELPDRLDELEKNRTIVVYCRNGTQSASASQLLVDNGFTMIYNMQNGIEAWMNTGYQVYVRYPSIQAAIDNATKGDALRISSGTYVETITINKPLTLEGENKTTTVISNNYTAYHTITMKANNTCIQDLTIKNGYYAIFASQPLINLTIQNNIVRDNNPPLASGWGIALYGARHIIRNNIIANNGFGIVLGNYGSTIIIRNTIINNSASGIELRNSVGSRITENFLANNLRNLALYTNSNNNTIIDNDIVSSMHGITIHDSGWNLIAKNMIKDNESGISLLNSNGNTFYHNNLTNNTAQLENNNLTSNWDNGFDEGNYWSDYNGTDTNGDGIGDSPYVIDANNQDNYPLMSPYIPGDYNHDGVVNMTDVDMVRDAWQSRTGDLNFNHHVDCNMDGIVNIADAAVVGVNWLKGNLKPLWPFDGTLE